MVLTVDAVYYNRFKFNPWKIMTSKTSKELGVCLVTGGNGWLASHLVSQLTQRSCKVISLDLSFPSISTKPENNASPAINWSLVTPEICDIRDREALLDLMKKHRVATVFHPCAICDVRCKPASSMWAVNVDGTANLIAACQSLSKTVRRLIYTSSVDVVHDNVTSFSKADERVATLKLEDNSSLFSLCIVFLS